MKNLIVILIVLIGIPILNTPSGFAKMGQPGMGDVKSCEAQEECKNGCYEKYNELNGTELRQCYTNANKEYESCVEDAPSEDTACGEDREKGILLCQKIYWNIVNSCRTTGYNQYYDCMENCINAHPCCPNQDSDDDIVVE